MTGGRAGAAFTIGDAAPKLDRQSRSTGAVRQGPPAKLHPYYDYGPLLSRHGVWNFLAGARGVGKSYGAKRRAIKNWLKKKTQFIYLRRYKDEMRTARDTFFADIAHEFPEWDFRVWGNTFQIAPASTRDAKGREWKIIGYAIVLSTSQQMKSVSFPDVTLIIFDEFIIEKGVVRYLPDEATVFMNFFNTVDRGQDKTMVLFLANAITITNPYFLEYDILPTTEDGEFLTLHDGFIVCHFPKSEEYGASIRDTRFGRFIEKTEYAKYAIDNQFADNHDAFIAIRPAHAKHMFNLETRVGWMSLWMDVPAGEYYAISKLPPGQLTYTMLPDKADETKTLITRGDMLVDQLMSAYRTHRMSFDTPATRNKFIDFFKQSR